MNGREGWRVLRTLTHPEHQAVFAYGDRQTADNVLAACI